MTDGLKEEGNNVAELLAFRAWREERYGPGWRSILSLPETLAGWEAWKGARSLRTATGCAECGRLDGDGWALYCVRCALTFAPQVAAELAADKADESKGSDRA